MKYKGTGMARGVFHYTGFILWHKWMFVRGQIDSFINTIYFTAKRLKCVNYKFKKPIYYRIKKSKM